MGPVFGISIVASVPTIAAAVFVAGGVPGGEWTDDPELRPLLTGAASRLDQTHVLMLNKTDDEAFPAQEVRLVFDCVAARSKNLKYWPGSHDDWGPDLLDASVRFIREHAG